MKKLAHALMQYGTLDRHVKGMQEYFQRFYVDFAAAICFYCLLTREALTGSTTSHHIKQTSLVTARYSCILVSAITLI